VIYRDVRRICIEPIPDELHAAIELAEQLRKRAEAWREPANFQLLADILRLVGIERELRNFLRRRGVPVSRLGAITCLHAALDDEVVGARRLPERFLPTLKKALVLRNLLVHGGLVALTESHRAVMTEAEAKVREVLSAAEFCESGGKADLGNFHNPGLMAGLAAFTSVGGQLSR
jgi:hypothetical protein